MRLRPRVVICGTKFGRVYLSAFHSLEFPFELAGILARGSARSRACAEHYGVSLFTSVDQLPDDVDIACVVVGSVMNGGSGAELARSLMARGIHVLHEHPVHHDELAACLRQAHRFGVVYRLNTHYPHVGPIRRFTTVAKALFEKQRPIFVDAVGSVQTAYTLFDILGRALGGVRPWGFGEIVPLPTELSALTGREVPFRSLDGVIAGVPLTLRIQNQLEPSNPDNHAHFFHRITFGTQGGTLTLVNTHGPILWCPQPHLPADTVNMVAMENSSNCYLDFPSAAPLGPTEAPSYREILKTIWPAAVRRALLEVRDAIVGREDHLRSGQYYLTLCQLWRDALARLGSAVLIRRDPPRVLSADQVMETIIREEGKLG